MRLPSRLTIGLAVTVATIAVAYVGIRAELGGVTFTAHQHHHTQPADNARLMPAIEREGAP
ncbi:MAG TPA: hypothetical protein VGD63_01730 [Steroidobacteraceae bacterium]